MNLSERDAALAAFRAAQQRLHAADLARLPKPVAPAPTLTARERAIQRAIEAAR